MCVVVPRGVEASEKSVFLPGTKNRVTFNVYWVWMDSPDLDISAITNPLDSVLVPVIALVLTSTQYTHHSVLSLRDVFRKQHRAVVPAEPERV